MVTLLAKLFIRDHENVTDSGVRQAYGMLCGIVGIFFNLILFTTKALAGFFSHSIAITADAFNNLSDAASSIIAHPSFSVYNLGGRNVSFQNGSGTQTIFRSRTGNL